MKILLLILQIHDNNNIKKTINTFLEYFLDISKISQTIFITRNYQGNPIGSRQVSPLAKALAGKDFNTIPSKIIEYNTTFYDLKTIKELELYDYVLYIDDNWIFTKKFSIENALVLLENHEQVFLTNDSINYQGNPIGSRQVSPLARALAGKKFNFDDEFYIFDSIKQIFLDQKNKFTNSNEFNLNSKDYVNNDYVNWPHFKLLPSLIKSNVFNLKTDKPLYKNLYYEKLFAERFISNNYTSNSLNDTICIKNVTKYEKSDNVTIVTGYISIKKTNFKKHKYNYLESSIDTLSIPQNMVIFISEDIKQHILDIRGKLNLLDKTKIIIVTKEDLYMYEHLDKIEENCKKNNHIYDKPLYIMAVNVRYNYMKRAVQENYFNSDYFAWIDFGASHIVEFPQNFQFSYNNKNKIRVSWIARFKKNNFVYNHKCLGGGIFIGHKDIMLEFVKLHDEFFLKLMNLGYNINDDKLLWLMFEKYPELFDLYFSSYGLMLHRI